MVLCHLESPFPILYLLYLEHITIYAADILTNMLQLSLKITRRTSDPKLPNGIWQRFVFIYNCFLNCDILKPAVEKGILWRISEQMSTKIWQSTEIKNSHHTVACNSTTLFSKSSQQNTKSSWQIPQRAESLLTIKASLHWWIQQSNKQWMDWNKIWCNRL